MSVLLAACGSEPAHADLLTSRDSLATEGEVRVSLAGARAPGAQSYSYRGLYAGISRAELEASIGTTASDSSCHVADVKRGGLACTYAVSSMPDSAFLAIDVTYGNNTPESSALAKKISIVRQLPLDVDGIRLAHLLADAFESQTSLLDKRDASYGRHSAQVRMGTLNGTRENFVDLSVVQKAGRDMLTVTLSRSDAASAPKK